MADVAVVKNREWDSVKDKYPKLEEVGPDQGENSDGTLIASTKTDAALIAKVKEALLKLESDNSPKCLKVKESLAINGYIDTSEADFGHTLALVKKAGVTESYTFD